MNVACDYEAPMQMLTTEKYIASRRSLNMGLTCGGCWEIEIVPKKYQSGPILYNFAEFGGIY